MEQIKKSKKIFKETSVNILDLEKTIKINSFNDITRKK